VIRLLPYPQNFGKPSPVVVKTFTHVFREADFPNDPWPFLAGGCHCFLDDIQHEFRWRFHATGDPVEVRLVDGVEARFPAQIERKTVVLDVVNSRYQVVCRRQLGCDFVCIDHRPVFYVGITVSDEDVDHYPLNAYQEASVTRRSQRFVRLQTSLS
jgi:hypothetical protein